MIAVVDYGAGNLRSVSNTLDALNANYVIVRKPETLKDAARIILPGVGHFGQMMRALDAMDMRGPLVNRIEGGTPFLGICLGMQALFESSAEAPDVAGFGIFEGSVERFAKDVRVPHMGWNRVKPRENSRLFRELIAPPWFYFAHSYYVPAKALAAATCDYSVPFTASLEHENVFGVQFHPEKSAAAGAELIQKFLEL